MNSKAWKRQVIKQARAQGWRVREGANHTLIYPADGGRPVTLPHGARQPGYGNAHRNAEANLKRRGLDL